MKIALRIAALGGLLAATILGQVTAAPADSHFEVLLDGTLANPRGLTFDGTGNLYIAESGTGGDGPCIPSPDDPDAESCYGDTGAITRVTDVDDAANTVSQFVTGLPSHAAEDDPDTADVNEDGTQAAGPADVSVAGTNLYFTIGLGADPAVRDDELESATNEDMFGTIQTVLLADGTGLAEVADVAQHEADNDPDAEAEGEVDSNPFGLVAGTDTIEVIDSGGNFQATVTIADNTVATSEVFSPIEPGVPVPAFLGQPAGTRFPAQAVPTQLVASDGGGYDVGLLTGFPFHPGASDLLHTDSDVDTVPETLLEGFTNVMDLAWGPDDMLYVLEFSHGGIFSGTPGALLRVNPVDGTRELLANDLQAPGGIAFGPDEMAYMTIGSDSPEGSLIRMDAVAAEALVSVTDDSATTTEDEPIEIDALDNDGDGLVIRSLPDNSAGAIWEGSVMYQPAAHFRGQDSITYEACTSEEDDADCLIGVIDVTVNETEVDRIDGATRIETAADASRAKYPDGAPTVVIAFAYKYPDALAGAPLAKLAGGPILLTPSDSLHADVATEINRLGATKAYILGGPISVEPAVEAALKSSTTVTEVERIGGKERFETAQLIKAEIEEFTGETATDVYITEGIDDDEYRGWPDAMSVSSLAAFEEKPILLVRTESVPEPTMEALDGVTTATIIGGPFSVNDDVHDEIDAKVADVSRLWGDDRYDTSLAVAKAAVDAGMSSELLWLASGGNWPDALVIGPLVAVDGGVMMLVHPDDLNDSPETRSFIEDNDPFTDIDLAGGPNTIAEDVRIQIAALVQ